MRTRSRAALALVTIGLAALPPAAGAANSRCVPGTAEAAGVALFGAGTELARTDRVAGLRTALVLEPYIAPGTRHRLIAVPGGWCDAERGFNRAWAANGRSFADGAAMAATYARLAAAPYFDRTTVTEQHSVDGAHTLATHALTNGVVAQWMIVTDRQGVRAAHWAETAYAVKPFVPQWEGITAVDGAFEDYSRGAGGLLVARHGLPSPEMAASDAPAAEVSYTGPDGFKIVVSISESRQAVDTGVDTGVSRADILRMTRDIMAENYQDFYGWGFRAAWSPAKARAVVVGAPNVLPAPAKTGYVYINDATSAYCQACVYVGDDFQIHFVSEFRAFMETIGYKYGTASDRDVLSSILGHEMFHNWQNNYTKPDAAGRSVPDSYSEGTARFQQTLHRYSPIEHQSTTLLYADDLNGCNGFAGTPPDTAFAGGPWEDPTTYNACNFWLAWYGFEGLPALVNLVTTGMAYDTTKALTAAEKVMGGIASATGKPYAESAAEWAANIITRTHLTWAPPMGGAGATDWSTYLERWTPRSVLIGSYVSRILGNGGVMANLVSGTSNFTATITSGARLAVLRDGPSGVQLTWPAPTDVIPAAATDEDVYVIGVYPKKGTLSTRITLTAAA